jgi:hypothetical protein
MNSPSLMTGIKEYSTTARPDFGIDVAFDCSSSGGYN